MCYHVFEMPLVLFMLVQLLEYPTLLMERVNSCATQSLIMIMNLLVIHNHVNVDCRPASGAVRNGGGQK